jgi:hypothetical protein
MFEVESPAEWTVEGGYVEAPGTFLLEWWKMLMQKPYEEGSILLDAPLWTCP